jgi:hypothetical protein
MLLRAVLKTAERGKCSWPLKVPSDNLNRACTFIRVEVSTVSGFAGVSEGIRNRGFLAYLKILWSWRWGKTTSLNCCHQRGYCSFPRWYTSMEDHGGMMSTWETTDSSIRTFLAVLPAGGTWRRKRWIWPSKYLCSYVEVIFYVP